MHVKETTVKEAIVRSGFCFWGGGEFTCTQILGGGANWKLIKEIKIIKEKNHTFAIIGGRPCPPPHNPPMEPIAVDFILL